MSEVSEMNIDIESDPTEEVLSDKYEVSRAEIFQKMVDLGLDSQIICAVVDAIFEGTMDSLSPVATHLNLPLQIPLPLLRYLRGENDFEVTLGSSYYSHED